jgi:hypothetical protein
MHDVSLNYRPNGLRKYFIFRFVVRAIRPVRAITMVASLTLMLGVSEQKSPVKPIQTGHMLSRTRYGSLLVGSLLQAWLPAVSGVSMHVILETAMTVGFRP